MTKYSLRIEVRRITKRIIVNSLHFRITPVVKQYSSAYNSMLGPVMDTAFQVRIGTYDIIGFRVIIKRGCRYMGHLEIQSVRTIFSLKINIHV
jgi:hypothetical protein